MGIKNEKKPWKLIVLASDEWGAIKNDVAVFLQNARNEEAAQERVDQLNQMVAKREVREVSGG